MAVHLTTNFLFNIPYTVTILRSHNKCSRLKQFSEFASAIDNPDRLLIYLKRRPPKKTGFRKNRRVKKIVSKEFDVENELFNAKNECWRLLSTPLVRQVSHSPHPRPGPDVCPEPSPNIPFNITAK